MYFKYMNPACNVIFILAFILCYKMFSKFRLLNHKEHSFLEGRILDFVHNIQY